MMDYKRGLGYLCALCALAGGCQRGPAAPAETNGPTSPPATATNPPPILDAPAPSAGDGAPTPVIPTEGMTPSTTGGGMPGSAPEPAAMGAGNPSAAPGETQDATPTADTSGPGIHRIGPSQMVFRTEEFTVPAQGETYLCWPANTKEAFKVQAFDYKSKAVVHHFLFSRTIKPEPDGFTECDVLYKDSWLPVFAAGASDSTMSFPDGVAQSINKGQQMVVQMHLLNASDEDITEVAEITMNLTDAADPIPVNIGVFGTTDIMLPPAQPGSATHECDTTKDHRVVAILPHMHQLGTSMMLELGDTPESMEIAYQRDPYDFDQQEIDSMDMLIPAGTHARVTCNYNNTYNETVTYGESTFDEMCYMVTFTAGPGPACIRNNPVDPSAGE